MEDIINHKKPQYCIMKKSKLPFQIKIKGEELTLINATSCAPHYGQKLIAVDHISRFYIEPQFELIDINNEKTIIKNLPCSFTYENRLAYPFIIIGVPFAIVGDTILSPVYLIAIYCAFSDWRPF